MRVTALYSYTVKGAAGIAHEAADVGPAGLAGDRQFLVTDTDGVYRTQRADPRLALIRPAWADDGVLALAAPDVEPIAVSVDRAGPRRPIVLFKHHLTGIDQGDAVAEWVSAVLGRPSRLVAAPPEHDRVTDGAIPGTAGYADSSAVHLIAEESLADLNARLDAPLPMARFRPNIVVAGAPAYAEDALRRLRVGDVELGWTKLAARCAVTLVDPATGRRAGPEPLRAFARYRRDPTGGVVFGTKFAVLRSGRVRVGDPVSGAAASPATAAPAASPPATPAAAG
ncbi:MOSC domain-containing protein [Pseudonocardia sp. CA-107938]|uniref:MOSC domain-containing protein n=1 Tax=Pseudonocardia sp. CA-107938 TaxID=3240021 RepID=UPI003D904811